MHFPRSAPTRISLDEPFSLARLQHLLRTAWLGRDSRYEPVVGSTMDVARAALEAGSGHGTVIIAGEQTAGRGRFGRPWHTPPGAGLAFSVILEPDLARLKALSMLTSLALVEGIGNACALTCSIKWPNDIQAGGRKLGGILIDAELAGEMPRFALVGAGVNVNYDTRTEPDLADIATSISVETGRQHERELVLAECLNAIERCYEQDPAIIRLAWREKLSTLGAGIRVTVAGAAHTGEAVDVSDDGGLVLRTDDGELLTLSAGEVTLRP